MKFIFGRKNRPPMTANDIDGPTPYICEIGGVLYLGWVYGSETLYFKGYSWFGHGVFLKSCGKGSEKWVEAKWMELDEHIETLSKRFKRLGPFKVNDDDGQDNIDFITGKRANIDD